MRATIFALVVSLAVTAQAQTTTTATAGSTTATAAETKPVVAKKYKISAATQVDMGAGEYAGKGSDSQITSANTLAYTIIADATTSHKFAFNFEANRIPLKADAATSEDERVVAGGKLNPEGYAPLDPYYAFVKNHGSILGSEPLSAEYRFIPAVNAYNRQGVNTNNNRYGTFRVVGELAYTITPKVSLSYSIDPRLSFRQAGHTLSWRHYANAYYSVSDKVQPYVSAGMWHAIGRAGEVDSLVQLRRPFDDKTQTAPSNIDKAALEYGVNLMPVKGVALSINYSSLYDVGPGADSAFNYDNSSYGLIAGYSF
jgi:hypothetical protein